MLTSSVLQSSAGMGTGVTLSKKKKKNESKLGKTILEAHRSTEICNFLNVVTVHSTFFYAVDWSSATLSQRAGVHHKFAAV